MALLHLDDPPMVSTMGTGRHGSKRSVDRFTLPDLWALHLYSYRATLIIDDHAYELRPNHVSLVPPGCPVEYRYRGPSRHLYAHFRASPTGHGIEVPPVTPAGAEAPILTTLLRGGVEAKHTSPTQAQAYLWAALWRVAALSDTDANGSSSPYVRAATNYLDDHLATPVTVAEVARQVGLSHNHLTRLFQATLGCTVVEYLRTARLNLAAHLLRESTMPIANIAATVGIPDLQAFNKSCRRVLGESPRRIRTDAGVGNASQE